MRSQAGIFCWQRWRWCVPFSAVFRLGNPLCFFLTPDSQVAGNFFDSGFEYMAAGTKKKLFKYISPTLIVNLPESPRFFWEPKGQVIRPESHRVERPSANGSDEWTQRRRRWERGSGVLCESYGEVTREKWLVRETWHLFKRHVDTSRALKSCKVP